jgi:hypothetical protein
MHPNRAVLTLATAASIGGLGLVASTAQAAGDAGAVYVLSNQPAGNAVLAYTRSADGTLTFDDSYPTTGTGTGGGLGSQGAVVVCDAEAYLYAVDAGSDSITSFRITDTGLDRVGTVPSGGVMPTSLTARGDRGAVPFGFDFDNKGHALVSEAAASTTSSYDVSGAGLATISASVPNTEAAACWLVATANGKFAYTGNAGGSLSISGYRVRPDGSLSLLTPGGKAATTAGGVTDLATSRNSRFLYSRLGDGTVGAFEIGSDGGRLSPRPAPGGPTVPGVTELQGVPGRPDWMTTDIHPDVLTATRVSLHRVAEHLLAATRKRATGQITLAQGPGGFRTPPLPDGGALAVDGSHLVVTGPGGERREPLRTIGQAAAFAGVPAGFPWTKHPPATAFEPDEPLTIDEAAAAALAGWFRLGQEALSSLATELAAEDPSEPQIFPEHFDLGMSAGAANYGFSPGDDAIPEPYVYVGPHRLPPPDGDFWNAQFGAVRTWSQVSDARQALDFLRAGRCALDGRPDL